MSGGFQILDIILIAVIALFLVARLRNALGRRDGHEHRNNDNVFQLSDAAHEKTASPDESDLPGLLRSDDKTNGINNALQDLKKYDPSFDIEEFVKGAGVAFEMILKAFTAHDLKMLETLLSPELFSQFSAAIKERETKNHKLEDVLVSINSAEIIESYMENKTAFITIEFSSQQVNATRDEKDNVIDGDPNTEISVTDFWTFARSTKSNNPNWTLVQTKSPE